MKKINRLYIHRIDKVKMNKLSFPFLPWRREKVGITADEYQELIAICYDFLYLDFCQMLYNSGYKESLEFHFQQNDFAQKMLSDSSSIMALQLNLLHFNRLQFLSNLTSKRANFLSQNISIEIYPNINNRIADILLNIYDEFLKKWCFNPIFFMLFSLPYNQQLHVPSYLWTDWACLKKDIEDILDFFNDFIHSELIVKIFYFWLTRLHEANLWDKENDALKSFCKSAFFYDDMENNRVHTYADYCGTSMGGQFIREYGIFLDFPIHYKDKIKSYDRNKAVEFLDRQVYDRLGSCLVAAREGKKGKLLVNAIIQPNSISDDEALEVLRFLKYYSSVHFMGHIGELFGLAMAQMASNDIFDLDVVCIPGSSISINTKNGIKQGPDGIFGNIIHIDGKLQLIIEGLIEVKSYRVSQKNLQQQLKQHAMRLLENDVLLTASSLHELGVWLPKETIENTIDIESFKIDKVCMSEKLQYIAIVPAYKKERQNFFLNDNFHLMEMPWNPKGFKAMALYFIIWIVENYGRIGDENNYEIGRNSLDVLLRRLEKVKTLKNSDIYMVQGLLKSLKVRIGNPDEYWF